MRLKIFDLGLIDFDTGIRHQHRVFDEVKRGLFESVLLICRHYPAVTLGRKADRKNIFLDEDSLLAKAGIKVYQAARGGDVTYHGPGQVVAYPVVNLAYFDKDIHLFLRRLESAVIDLLSVFSIEASRRQGITGVWVKDEKIASIGIAVRNWITFHGVSVNVSSDDLKGFDFIRPCGMEVKMTSMEKAAGRRIDISEVGQKFGERFKAVFEQ